MERVVHWAATLALATLLVTSAVTKSLMPSLDTHLFLREALGPGWSDRVLALVEEGSLWIEGLLAVLLVTPRFRKLSLLATGALLICWWLLLRESSRESCGCFGEVLRLTRAQHQLLLQGALLAWVTSAVTTTHSREEQARSGKSTASVPG